MPPLPPEHCKNDPCKIAIISDTHGEISPDIIETIRHCEQIIHAGDICGAHVLEQLNGLCSHVTAVTGNNDAAGIWAENETAIVNALPAIAEIELPGGTLVIEHGHKHGMHQPDHASLRAAHPHARVIVYGHTHTMLIDDSQAPWVVNPGAAGATRTRGGPSCLMLTASSESEWDIQMIRFEDKAVA
ncbi:phosphoesterase, putative [hydrothermal vent metagenome]|uniref:Phosphoesterase, putative n=2 Tax=hydrothermal vent metagenome TaxID=652676 RepID=A0A3B0XRY1_9ZZZZ